MVPVFKDVREKSMAKKCHPPGFLSVVNKIVEKLINNRLFNHLEKCGLFSNFQYGFRSSQSTVELLKSYGVTDRIARAFNRSDATWAVVLDISKAFNKIWHAEFLHKHKSYGISGR